MSSGYPMAMKSVRSTSRSSASPISSGYRRKLPQMQPVVGQTYNSESELATNNRPSTSNSQPLFIPIPLIFASDSSASGSSNSDSGDSESSLSGGELHDSIDRTFHDDSNGNASDNGERGVIEGQSDSDDSESPLFIGPPCNSPAPDDCEGERKTVVYNDELGRMLLDLSEILKSSVLDDRSTRALEERLDLIERDAYEALKEARQIRAEIEMRKAAMLAAISTRVQGFRPM
ncbi:hypothetical protein V5O48_010357 [Marasmius crinis-equi]|uniref:Uncharacterized protein n=2 Tax=Marasmius crinis-equi TaxID=585013 RepID=A0ABR3F8P1_9AGAR